MAARYVARIGPRINTPFRKFCYNLSGFNRYGLMLNDVYCEHGVPELNEAIKRLPPDVADARMRRIDIAFQLSSTHSILPKDQWTKYEEDVKYLDPYIEEVKREWAEKRAYKWSNFEAK